MTQSTNNIRSSYIIKTSCEENNLDSSTRLIKQAAQRRNIEYKGVAFFEQKGLFHQIYTLKYKNKIHMMDVTRPDITSSIASTITINKELTKIFLKQNGLPCTESEVFNNEKDAIKHFEKTNYPCVVKPIDGGGGKGVSIDIRNIEQLKIAIDESQNFSEYFLVEKMLEGEDYRCLCIGGKVVSISRRVPPSVTGDGNSTIQELIDKINSTRSDKRTGMLSKIPIDAPLKQYLKSQNLTLDTKLESNKKVFVRQNANLNTGGYSINYPVNTLNKKTKEEIERAAILSGLQVTGIDIICKDLSAELSENNGNIIEMNSKPRFRMHESPQEGKPVKVSEYLIDLLFPETSSGVKSLEDNITEYNM